MYREAGKQDLIETVDDWFVYHKARNLTSHTYNETTAEETYKAAVNFAVSAQMLVDTLERKLAGND